MSEYPKFTDLLGRIIARIVVSDGKDELDIFTADGHHYRQYHSQDCCERVEIAEIIGDLGDLIGSPVLLAEEVESKDETPDGVKPPEYPDSYTWTFYKLSTIKGSVTIRWLGESNGYYSEGVDFCEVRP